MLLHPQIEMHGYDDRTILALPSKQSFLPIAALQYEFDSGGVLGRYKPGSKPPAPRRSFRNHWESRCEGEWNRAFYLLAFGETTQLLSGIEEVVFWFRF